MDFFRQQVVFLTGSTGGLGGCLLYKLTVVLKVPRVYVLVRKTPSEVLRAWATTMPHQVDQMLQTNSIYFVNGDIMKPRFGIKEHDWQIITKDTTVVINSAANIQLHLPLKQLVAENCLPPLELAKMAIEFPHLVSFVQLSTAYSGSDLPDGPVDEKIYALGDVDQLLSDVLAGKVEDWAGFPWPYALSKRLMECALSKHYSQRLPLLIARPSIIGPALQEPFELYLPLSSCPINNYYFRMMCDRSPAAVFHAPENVAPGENIMDEIPVDLVANIILQHVQHGTKGVVHATSQCYIPRTVGSYMADLDHYVPRYWKRTMAKPIITTDHTTKQCAVAEFYGILARNWQFQTDMSSGLDMAGPIGLDIGRHDIDAFTEKRVVRIFAEMVARLEKEGGVKSTKTGKKV